MMRLLGSADVFVHNMRDSAIAKLGLSYSSISEAFPRLIYAAAQGFGTNGRYAGRPAYDDVIQGLSGVSGLNERMTGAAGYIPMLITDKLCGVYLAYAVATALLHRANSGRGQEVRVPMFETMAAFNLHDHLADAALVPASDEQAETPLGYSRVFGRFHRPLATKDGYICVIANTDEQWRRLFRLLGRPELEADTRFADITQRMANIDALYEIVENALLHQPSSDWLALLQEADIPAGPSYALDELRNDPHLNDVGFFTEYEHDTEGTLLTTRPPIEMSESHAAIHRGPRS